MWFWNFLKWTNTTAHNFCSVGFRALAPIRGCCSALHVSTDATMLHQQYGPYRIALLVFTLPSCAAIWDFWHYKRNNMFTIKGSSKGLAADSLRDSVKRLQSTWCGPIQVLPEVLHTAQDMSSFMACAGIYLLGWYCLHWTSFLLCLH